MTTAPQRSPEWFEARKGRVTGSIAGAILGLSPYMTRKDAMRSMVRAALGEPSEFEGNVATMHGNFYEDHAIEEYETRSCKETTEVGFVTYSDWLGASPDRKTEDNGVLEVKCPFGLRKEANPVFKTAEEQPHYYAQMQIEMEVTASRYCHFYQWVPPLTAKDGSVIRESKDRLETVFPDRDWLETNLPILRDFWLEFKSELQHNPDDYRNPLRVEVDTPDAHRAVAEYDQLVEAIANAEERKKELLLNIAAMTNEQDGLIAGRKLTRVQKAGAVSYAKALKALMPDADLAPYTGKPSSFWKLS